MNEESKQTRQRLIQNYIHHQLELTRQQRKYKRIISTKFSNRKELIAKACFHKNIQVLKEEKSKLRAQLWVANGVAHLRQNKNRLKSLESHVENQKKLNFDIKELKSQIQVMEVQLKIVNKSIYDLNRKTIPDKQHEAHVIKIRRSKEILKSQFDVGVRLNCNCTALNEAHRESVVRMITFRAFFDDLYTKLIQQLRSDNKYIIDLIEYALMTFENDTSFYEKIIAINKKERHDREVRKVEMQIIKRKFAQDNQNIEFYASKDKKRDLHDLEPREYKRRELFKKTHERKIRLFENIVEKTMQHSANPTLANVIHNFKEQESLYYSYFSYANQTNYQMTILNTNLNALFKKIATKRTSKHLHTQDEIEKITSLEEKLNIHVKTNQNYEEKMNKTDKTLVDFVREVQGIIALCRTDVTPIQTVLGDFFKLNAKEIRKKLEVLEKRLNQIVASVFIMQRKDNRMRPGHYIVKNLQKKFDIPTGLNDIAVTQECPECAEGDAINTVGSKCQIQTREDVRKKIHEKVLQPEMQYRLHSLSECRLQRSRMLANNKLNDK